MREKPTRITVDLSPSLYQLLDRVVDDCEMSGKADFVRKAILIIADLIQARRDGRFIGTAADIHGTDFQPCRGSRLNLIPLKNRVD